MPQGDEELVHFLSRNESMFVYGETDEQFVINALRIYRTSVDAGENWEASYETFANSITLHKRNSRLNVIVGNKFMSGIWLVFSWFGLHFQGVPMQIKWARDRIDVNCTVSA
jgi:hypothetical protein